MLVGGICSICCHMTLALACFHVLSIFNLRLVLSILFYEQQTKSGIETPDLTGQWYQHLET